MQSCFLGWLSGLGYRLGPREVATRRNSFPLFLQDRVTTERTALSFALWTPPEEMTTTTGTWHCLRYLRSHSGVVGWQGLLRTSQLSIRLASLPVPSAAIQAVVLMALSMHFTFPDPLATLPGLFTFAFFAAPHQGDYFLPSIPRASPSPWLWSLLWIESFFSFLLTLPAVTLWLQRPVFPPASLPLCPP